MSEALPVIDWPEATDDSRTPLEARAEIDALQALHARRRAIVAALAPLRALHGMNGCWDAKRKQLLEACKVRARMLLQQKNEKTTESYIDALGHTDSQYERFLDESIQAKIEWVLKENEMAELTDLIRNRETCLNAYNAELKLAR